MIRDRDLDLALDRIRDLDLDLDLALDRVRDLACAHDLAGPQIDASGADLSGMEIRHLGALDGVTWTRETAWPPGIAGQVEKHSGEIRPGVYQVRLGYARDRDELPLA